MKLAIMSDSHDNWENLELAVNKANTLNCKYILFAGDLIAPPGVAILEKFQGEIKFVWGNNEMERMNLTRKMDSSAKIELCGDYFEGSIDGIKIFMNHYPRFTELAAKSGEFDLVIHGHTHDYRKEKVGETLLVNPGEIQGYATGLASFSVFDTETKQEEKILIANT